MSLSPQETVKTTGNKFKVLTRDLSPASIYLGGRRDIQGSGHVTRRWKGRRAGVGWAQLGGVRRDGRQPLSCLGSSSFILLIGSFAPLPSEPVNNVSRAPALPFGFSSVVSRPCRSAGRAEKEKEAGRLKEERGVEGRRDRNNVGSTRIVAQLDVRRLVRPVLSFALELLILVSSVCWGLGAEWKRASGPSWSPRFGTCLVRRAVTGLWKDKLTVPSP